MKKTSILIALFFSMFFCAHPRVNSDDTIRGSLLSFKENKGQIGDQLLKPRPDVLFTGNSNNLVFHLRRNGVSYQMYRVDKWREIDKGNFVPKIKARRVPDQITIYRLDINWLNINPNAFILKENILDGYENYYSEVCPEGVTGVRSYKNITYRNLYNGIDLKWYEKDGNLKYDYVVAPGKDYRQIQLEIQGAENIIVDKNGELVIKTPLGTLTEKKPYVTQNGKELSAKWIVNKNIISFDIGDIDTKKPLIIDPLVRLWGTYYGGNFYDSFMCSRTDASGNIYLSGFTDSPANVATSGSHQIIYGGGPSNFPDDAMLVKFNSGGARLWATYYGGTGGEYGGSCAVNPTGNYVVMVGGTSTSLSGVIATPGSYQVNYAGNASSWSGDAFIVLFDSAGIRQWGTYYGGPRDEWCWGCDFDANSNIYITGATISTSGIASAGAHQTNYGGGARDGFIAKFNSNGARLWGTYYGGDDWDYMVGCTVDVSDNVIVTGNSISRNNIATPGAFQPSLAGLYHWTDAVIAKFNSSGMLQWGTYYGGSSLELGYNSVTDADGNIYTSGITNGALPIISSPGSHQPVYGGGQKDGFLLKLTPGGARLWCTYFGGTGDEDNAWCCLDPSGNIYIIGSTSSTNAISTPCTWQENYSGGRDAYIAKFNSGGTRLWGTYFGGSGFEGGWGGWSGLDGEQMDGYWTTGAVDFSGNLYVSGSTNSSTGTIIASPGSQQVIYGGGTSDAFLVKFNGCIPNAPNTTNPTSLKVCKGKSTILTTSLSCNVSWFDVANGGTAIGTTSAFITPDLTTTTTFFVSDGSCGTDSVRTAITVSVNPLPEVSINVPGTLLCYNTGINAKASGATTYTWYPDKWINCTNCSESVLTPLETMTYCVDGMDANLCEGQACITIEVQWARNHDFSLPNAFTPDGDGNNDSFCLQGWNECNDSFVIRIFDRWGEKVFESTDPSFCWDGIYEGKLLSADTYVYSVNAAYRDGTKVNKKGNITLIR